MRTGLIYKITNTNNGNVYIGQTINSLSVRWQAHLNKAKHGHGNALGRAIRKHGKEAFTAEVVVNNVPSYFLSAFEKYWINHYNSFKGIGYNCTAGGEGTIGLTPWNKGIPMTDEAKAKLSEAMQGRTAHITNLEQLRELAKERTGSKHQNSKKATIYSAMTNEVIAENVPITEWCRDNGYNQGNLSSTARGERKQHKGIYARYTEKEV